MSSPSGYARNTPATQAQQLVAIQSVDLVNLKAYGYTRQESGIVIDLRYYVGAVHVIPSTGDQWIIRRFATAWILVDQLPFNGTELAAVADNPVQGTVQIGSTNPAGRGPLNLNGSQVNINANYRLGTTLYRDNNGSLEFQKAGTNTWTSVATGAAVVDWAAVTGRPATFPPTPPTGAPDGTKFWRDDNVWAHPAGGASAAAVIGEVPTGTRNGSNLIFTTSRDFVTASTAVYRNGLRERLSVGYSESTPHTLTFSTAPLADDDLTVDYQIA